MAQEGPLEGADRAAAWPSVHVLVPLKRLERAKTRLASLLRADERIALMSAMLADVLDAIGAASAVAATTLVSAEPSAPALAADHGVAVWDDGDLPWNDALLAATRAVVRERIVAIVSADIPLLTADDLEALVRATPPRGAAVARALDGGTNAVCLRPPGGMTTCFGTRGSAEGHLTNARRAGLLGVLVDRPGTALDLDSPDDVARFLALGRSTRTHRLLEELHPFETRTRASRRVVLT